MLGRDELIERLKRFDEDISLAYENIDDFNVYIVGGSALILMKYILRGTHDIDILNKMNSEIVEIMEKYDINNRVSAYIDSFADDYKKRAVEIPIEGCKVKYFALSLEDLVISKLSSSRRTDEEDITSDGVIENIDWDTLDEIAKTTREGMLNDRIVEEFNVRYENYVRRFRK